MPNVLQWLSTKLNCSSQVASLLAATASGDVDLVRGIIKANPELGLYNTQGAQGGGRSALTVAAERGDLEVLEIVFEGIVRAKGEAFARQFLNSGAERGQTPLMRACIFGTAQHLDCIEYLLKRGADPFAETEKGETCLHVAAKNAYTECLSAILSSCVSIGGGPLTRLADVTLPYTPPVKFVDMRNAAGFTPLHLAALKNSPTSMQVLLGAGASMEAGISDAGNTPHLAKGSTALHIAAARGSQPCCSVLLDFQAPNPGMDLRRIRNQRGLKASQLARLAGHDELARLLSERGAAGGRRARATRRRRRHRDALHTQGGGPRHASSPEAVLSLLVQRAKLLLSLRDVGLELDAQGAETGMETVKAAMLAKSREESPDSKAAKDEVAIAVAEFTELWQKGELEGAGKQSGSILGALLPADMPVAKLPAEILGESENGEDSFAAAAMVQAALNAMAFFSPAASPLDLPPTELKRTSPIAAAMVVQAAIRKLAGKSANQNASSAATLLQSMIQPSQQATPQHPPSTSAEAEPRAFGSSTPQAAEQRPSSRAHGGANPLHSLPLPRREEETHAAQSDEQVRRILSKARRRQKRNALQSIEVAALEADQDSAAGVETSARSSDSQSMGRNPLLDNPLFPRIDDGMGPGERRRAALRQAALRTAPQPSREHTREFSGNGPMSRRSSELDSPIHPSAAVPEPPTPPASMSSPFAGKSLSDSLPPAFPWESYVDPGNASPPGHNLPSSSRSLHGKLTANTPPRTPRRGSGTSGQASPSKASRHRGGAPDAPVSQPSVSESMASTSSRRLRGDASDAVSNLSGTTLPGSRLLRTDSMDYTPASLTPQVTPQPSENLFSQESGSESEVEDEGDDSDTKADLPSNVCSICMDQPLQVGISACEHKVCYGCAYQLCSRGLSPPICPFCRGGIKTFVTMGSIDEKKI